MKYWYLRVPTVLVAVPLNASKYSAFEVLASALFDTPLKTRVLIPTEL